MAQQTINIGASPNDGTGTPLRTAFQYTNSNFSELYTAVGPSGNNIVVPGSATITGDLTVDTSTLKVDSANNRVGIGTASPNNPLTVNGTVAAWNKNAYILYSDSGSTYIGGLGNGGSIFGSGTDNDIGITTGGATNLRLGTNNTERLRIDSAGNVGIGVTPNTWTSTFKAIQHPAFTLSSYSTTEAYFSQNAYYDGGWKRVAAGYASQYLAVNSEHRFLTAGTSSAGSAITFTQAMTLDASGRLLVGPTSANASGGVLQLSSGITFPATQVASSDANTLDDYEEGTWTPVVADASTGGNTGTCTINSAKYVKIGRQVSVQCDISGINTTGMTAGNTFFIRGLPFTSVQGGNGNFYTYRVGRNASTVSSSAVAPDATSHIVFSLFTTNSATTDLLILVSDIVSTSSQIILSVTYFV